MTSAEGYSSAKSLCTLSVDVLEAKKAVLCPHTWPRFRCRCRHQEHSVSNWWACALGSLDAWTVTPRPSLYTYLDVFTDWCQHQSVFKENNEHVVSGICQFHIEWCYRDKLYARSSCSFCFSSFGPLNESEPEGLGEPHIQPYRRRELPISPVLICVVPSPIFKTISCDLRIDRGGVTQTRTLQATVNMGSEINQ